MTRVSVLLAGLALLLTGCASVDFDYPRSTSTAVSASLDSRLSRSIGTRSAQHPGEAGFYLLDDGIEALTARLVLADRAERSIDIQYYLIKKDAIGYTFLAALLKAAERGVRIRLLLDDIFTGGYDEGLAALDAHTNIEIRLFNPFAWRSFRVLNVLEAGRLNRRMHNKVFIADNQAAILGGRNIAKEYFAAKSTTNFGDLDVLMIGPVVADSSQMFDSYWNHRKAMPVSALMNPPKDPDQALANLRERMATAITRLRSSPYIDALSDSVQKFLETQADAFTWAPYELVYDSPDKAVRSLSGEADSILPPLREELWSAKRELVVASPYFVPASENIADLRTLRERGVSVQIITNSLASNNHAIVHSGYAPKRKALLKAGVSLFEAKPDFHVIGTNRAGLESENSTLHTKAFIVDRHTLFLGSFNWDPRSANINTEMGVIIFSEPMARYAASRSEKKLPMSAYQVKLNSEGQLRWYDQQGDKLKVWSHEPETSWWKRFYVGLARILPLDSQL
jgi:putative cardiolipin synthase